LKRGCKSAFIGAVKRVTVLDNRFEADVFSDALSKEGIPHLVRSFEDTAYDGIYVSQKGWGEILVYEEHFERAKEIIEEARRGFD